MNFSVIIDWKTFAVIGATVVGVCLINKMDSPAIERMTSHISNDVKECVIEVNSNC